MAHGIILLQSKWALHTSHCVLTFLKTTVTKRTSEVLFISQKISSYDDDDDDDDDEMTLMFTWT